MPVKNSLFDSSDSECAINRYPLIVSPQTSVGEVIALMNQTQSSCAMVVETSAEIPALLGIFTEQDVVRLATGEHLGKCRRSKITRVMNSSPIVISPAETEDILTVYNLLCEHQIRHLPVVDPQGRLVGLITQESLLHVLHKPGSDSCRNHCLISNLQTSESRLPPSRNQHSAGTLASEGARFRSLIENRLLDLVHCDTQSIVKARTQEEQAPQKSLPQEEEPAQLDQQLLKVELAEEVIFLQATLLDQVPSAVIATDNAGNIIYWNKFAEQLYQWSAAEAIGKSVLEILCLDTNKALAQEIIDSLLETGQWEGEFTVQRKDGTSFVAIVRDSVITNQMGAAIGIVGISVDITNRKQMEEALRQSEERFRRLVETMNEGLIICDANGLVTYVNEKFGAMLGYSPASLLGRHLLQFPHKNNQERLEEEIAKRQRGESSSYELELTRKDGQQLFALVSSTPILDTDGKFQGAFAVFTDITDRKRYEEQLKNYQIHLEELVQLRTDEKTKVISQLQKTNEQLKQEIASRQLLVSSLQSSQRFIQRINDTTPHIVYLYDLIEDRNIYINQQFTELLGYSTTAFDTAAAKFLIKKLHPNDRPAIKELQRQTMNAQDGDVVEGEYRLQHANGEWRWFRSRQVIFTRDSAGVPQQILGTCDDITERKQSEEALRKSEDRYRAFVAQSSEAISCFEFEPAISVAISEDEQIQQIFQNAHLAECNDVLAQIYGFNSASEISGIRISNLVPYINGHYIEQLRALIRSGYRLDKLESHEVDAWGTAKYFLTSAVGIIENGFLVRLWTTQLDITERKQMEQALQLTQQHLQHLLGSSPAVIYSADISSDWGTNFISENVTGLLGYQPYEFTEDAKFWRQRIHPDDVGTALAAIAVLFEQKHHTDEYRFLRKDGSYRWMRDERRLICDAGGNPLEVVGYWADITTQKAAEEEIYKALAQEKELSELRSRFITLTSHEFRTPLCTILSSADLLEFYLEQETSQKYLEHIHRIQLAAVHMTQMLNDILLIDKSDAGKLECNPAPLNLEAFCRQMVEQVQSSNGAASQYTITFKHDGCCADVWMDEKLLRHIFISLLSNAIKYSEPSQPILFELIFPNEELILNNQTGEAPAQQLLNSYGLPVNAPVVIFRIQDRGIGIPVEDQPRIFESFYRGSNLHNQPGTGLGLAIVKKSVEAHSGQLLLESEVGAGTTFTVILPLHSPTVAELEATPERMR
ncbi:PAS domain S-box protein [Microcoleus sp. FACHB-68]|uniref:PAS domain S-box protein n=1 Tax=Microcoleus sp. FACHB-68 TaxID=2692826 RepID=UPI00199E478F|nr:PAS domain S-box protein [Microcoleus sp. FACHB-68]MBD1937019.1 PAS domain S-box protein [Microcoleus sp. FACHB-68]